MGKPGDRSAWNVTGDDIKQAEGVEGIFVFCLLKIKLQMFFWDSNMAGHGGKEHREMRQKISSLSFPSRFWVSLPFLTGEPESPVRFLPLLPELVAQTEKAWLGAGDELGVAVWRIRLWFFLCVWKHFLGRIEKFKVKHWPKERYGEFYGGEYAVSEARKLLFWTF